MVDKQCDILPWGSAGEEKRFKFGKVYIKHNYCTAVLTLVGNGIL